MTEKCNQLDFTLNNENDCLDDGFSILPADFLADEEIQAIYFVRQSFSKFLGFYYSRIVFVHTRSFIQ